MRFCLWWRGLQAGERLGQVHHMSVADVGSGNLGSTDMVSSVLRISVMNLFMGPLWQEMAAGRRCELIRRVWHWRRSFWEKFLKPGDFILDWFARTFSPARRCQLLDNHGRCFRRENDSIWIEDLMSYLLEAYAFQLVNDKSGIKVVINWWKLCECSWGVQKAKY